MVFPEKRINGYIGAVRPRSSRAPFGAAAVAQAVPATFGFGGSV